MWRLLKCAIFFTFSLQYFVRSASDSVNSFVGLSPDLESELPVEIQQLSDGSDVPIALNSSSHGNNVEQHPGELCNRACTPGDERICYFKFVLEHYQAMGVACGECLHGNESDCDHPQCIVGDGFERGVMSINRQIPGPAIQVCHNDRIIVDVSNMAHGTAASMHWHGLHMRATPWMDGVPFVTQCPIPFATTFRYQFIATDPGTQFYHSHAGHHKVNGQYGAIVIRQPSAEDAHASNYDFDLPEHHILISDWMHEYGENLVPGLPSFGGIYPDSMLINGRGSFINPKSRERKYIPPSRFYIAAGKRYRFRFINSVSHACPVQIQVERHTMVIIASDSYNVSPYPIDTLVTNSGERYDFVLEANQPPGDYWIRVRGLDICSHTDAVALLRYRPNDADAENDEEKPLPDAPSYNDRYAMGVVLNHPNASCFNGFEDHCITELSALEDDYDLRFAKPDYQYFLGFNNYPADNSELLSKGHYEHFLNLVGNVTVVGAINNISLVFPDSPPLTQPENIDDSIFCDEFNVPEKCLGNKLCSCVHRIRVKLGSIVELIAVDESAKIGVMHHPFHLHGYRFMVTGLGQHPLSKPMTVKLAKEMESRRLITRAYYSAHPPWKDTVSIPSFGYAIFRFRADNPGYWLMHCHYEWHLAIGMGLIVQIGENSDMVPPPEGFPKCGNYLPDLLPGL